MNNRIDPSIHWVIEERGASFNELVNRFDLRASEAVLYARHRAPCAACERAA